MAAGPPPSPLEPLQVDLAAICIQPELQAEFEGQSTAMQFECSGSDDPATHSSYRQHATLTNLQSCPLTFTVSSPGPFKVVCITSSQPVSREGQHGHPVRAATAVGSRCSPMPGTLGGSVKTGNMRGGRRAAAQPLQLPGAPEEQQWQLRPHEHVDVMVEYQPGAAGSSAAVEDAREQGHLLISYSNGHQQSLPVSARLVHAALHPSTAQLDFGQVHVQAPKPLRLQLANHTTACAAWRVVSTDAAAGSAPGTLGSFSVSPAAGQLPGRGLGLPKVQDVVITFSPQNNAFHAATLCFEVDNGSSCFVQISGQGSLEEVTEHQAKMTYI